MTTNELRKMMELHGSTVQVLSIHPGGIDTNIASSALGSTEEFRSAFRSVAATSAKTAAAQIVKALRQRRDYLLIGRDALVMNALKRVSPRLALRYARYMRHRAYAAKTT